MSLDLYHHEVVPQEMQCPTCEIINVQDFPDEFKAKFADYLFDVGVMVVDGKRRSSRLLGSITPHSPIATSSSSRPEESSTLRRKIAKTPWIRNHLW